MWSGGGNTHWCYQCLQPICPRGRAMVCPRCEGGFLIELEDLGFDVGSGSYGSYGPSPNQYSGIMDAFDSLTLRDGPDRRVASMEALDPHMIEGRRYVVFGPEYPPLPGPLLIFPGQMPPPGVVVMPPPPGIGGGRLVMRPVVQGNHNGGLFVGPEGLQELMGQLMTERQGPPPPAPRSAIDAMPTIKITRTHLQTDSHCPVCQDQFEVGTEARQMPCNHIYHSDCIVPWLVEHNSCPVCRHTLGSTPSNHGHGQYPSTNNRRSSSNNPRGGRESSDQNPGRRNPFSFLWPFRSSSNTSTQEYDESGHGSQTPTTGTSHGDNHEMGYSGWPFDY